MIEFEAENGPNGLSIAKIKVLGVGGGGCNIVNDMIKAGYENVDFIVANTDSQTLQLSPAPIKVQLGSKIARGQGAGANPEKGRKAAEEDLDKIITVLKDADVVFLTAGFGGGTGSGALPIIARALKDLNILTIAVITKPFIFEGKRRMDIALQALEQLKTCVDSVIIIPNQKLIQIVDAQVTLVNAFGKINSVLNQFVRAITDIITRPGHINVDFADIKAIMKDQGYAIIGSGKASGSDRAVKATQEALSLPLLENVDITGARGVLLNITGNSNLGLHELSAAASLVYEQAHEDANIILGSVIDESLGDEVIVSIIATGFDFHIPIQQAEPAKVINLKPELTKPVEIPAVEQRFDKITEEQKASIDLNNIDIPTVMRRIIQQQQKQS